MTDKPYRIEIKSGPSREGFPNYEEIKDERARRKRQEVEGGRQRVLKTMAEGLIERVMADKGLTAAGCGFHLDTSDGDWRQWTVTLRGKFIGEVTEAFGDFPSPELTTKLMLLGVIK